MPDSRLSIKGLRNGTQDVMTLVVTTTWFRIVGSQMLELISPVAYARQYVASCATAATTTLATFQIRSSLVSGAKQTLTIYVP